ncbi:unnamed protein product [Peronospora belbahrii]|uniref:RING-type E3 ubiquitin transferase n=1 Tax=Peronospora belbahrii TaxID=622444 RepID=A0ABN8CZ74_9STRA|nr:unnamed protein product [Peronospora belbahrii]
MQEENVDANNSENHDNYSEQEISSSSSSVMSHLPLSRATSVVTLLSPTATTLNNQEVVTFQAIAIPEENDNEVQILTDAEAAAEVAAAASAGHKLIDTLMIRKRKRMEVTTKPEPTECSICCEGCTIVGRHRLVALKCGHLFDHVAVVDNSGLENMRIKYQEEKLKSIRLEKEIETVKRHLEVKTNEALLLNMELDKLKNDFAHRQCMAEQRKLADATKAVSPASVAWGCSSFLPTTSPRQSAMQVTPFHVDSQDAALCLANELQPPGFSISQPLAEDAVAAGEHKYKPIFDIPLSSARVFSIARSCSFLCVGEKLGHDSHGVMTVDAQDPRHRLQVPVHSSAIRDICIHSMMGDVLTVAFDGKLAVTNFCQKKVILEVECPVGRRHGWSCCFSESDPNAMYCGFQDGTVAKYDMRKPAAGESGIVKTFTLPERQPVHSIKLFNRHEEGRSTEGLAAATFRGLSVWRDVADVMSEVDRSVDNRDTRLDHVSSNQACFSLASNQLHSEQAVVSSRSIPLTHSVFDLRAVRDGQLVPKVELTGHMTASVLSRSAIWSERNGSSVVASWSHDVECVTLWDVATHREVCGPEPIPLSVASAHALPVVDIQHTVANNDWSSGIALLGTITPRQLSTIYSKLNGLRYFSEEEDAKELKDSQKRYRAP